VAMEKLIVHGGQDRWKQHETTALPWGEIDRYDWLGTSAPAQQRPQSRQRHTRSPVPRAKAGLRPRRRTGSR
jgi:hypothetical protein